MNLLLAAIMLIWGNISSTHSNANMQQMVQASMDAKQAAAALEQKKQEEAAQKAADKKTKTSGTGQSSQDNTKSKETLLAQRLKALESADKTDPQKNTAPTVKGMYSTASTAGGSHLDRLLNIIDKTDLNSLVIDVKDDYGQITFETGDPKLDAMGTTHPYISNIQQLMDKLKQHKVYPIARIVTFKDTVLANKKPDWSFRTANGKVWNVGTQKHPTSFINPYEKQVWDYNVEVAKAAAKAGFKEIQFDYVRFAEQFSGAKNSLSYTKDDRSSTDVIADFVKYARKQLKPYGVRISVDIFGYTTSVKEASGIGQDFDKISVNTDVIDPMIYPSHYGPDWFGFAVPDAHPYGTIDHAVKDALNEKYPQIKGYTPILRPWIQDFTASWVKGHITYSTAQVNQQIQALKDNGINEFLLWDAGNVYSPGVNYSPAAAK